MDCLIAGATGLVGNELLAQLLADSRVVSVTAIQRRPSSIENPKLRTLNSDFSRLENLPRASIAFCCLGTTIARAGSQAQFFTVDHDYVLRFASASFAAGVEAFAIVSALGADSRSPVFYNRVKGQTEDDLKKIGFSRLLIIQPSLLLGDRAERRPLERAAQALSPILLPLMAGPLRRWRPVEASKVAAKIKAAVLDEPASAFRLISNSEI